MRTFFNNIAFPGLVVIPSLSFKRWFRSWLLNFPFVGVTDFHNTGHPIFTPFFRFKEMVFCVIFSGCNNQIFDPVIKFIPIDVVNDFPIFKRAVKKFLHNMSLLKDLFTANGYFSIPTAYSSSPFWSCSQFRRSIFLEPGVMSRAVIFCVDRFITRMKNAIHSSLLRNRMEPSSPKIGKEGS